MEYGGNPPMELGEVLAGKDSDGNLINDQWLGQVFVFPASRVSANLRGGKNRRTGKPIKAILLRNESGITLYGKRLARLTPTAGYSLCESVNGYAAGSLACRNVVGIDEFLPSAGVADDAIFWGIIGGPFTVLVPATGAGMNGDIAVGNHLVAGTGTTTQSVTQSGRVSNITLPGTTGATDAVNMAAGIVGRALSARTTGETTAGTDLLVDLCINLGA